ncbi:MAG TPA: TIGR00730 family Rossman fold protein, partial [Leptospiraceae bacterium]|nr:TIGR00730 family Rossman fold protein [Leptospiraceae bacterium]
LTEWALTKCKNPSRQDKFVICTGGGPGIMEAGNKGARLAGGRSIALNIKLPHEQAANPYVDPNLTFTFHYFFMRKLWFMQLAEAVVVMPGGFGTIDELFEVLTLIQTSKAAKIPIILYGKDFWNDLINFEKLADYKLIERSDLNLIYRTDSVDEAVEFIVTYLESDMFQ